MKRLTVKCFFVLLLSVFFSSCSKDKDQVMPELVISVDEVSLSGEGETQFFHVKSNVEWKLTGADTWLSVNPKEGKPGTTKVEVTSVKNAQNAVQRAVLALRAASLSKQVVVIQQASVEFEISQSEFDVDADGQEISFAVVGSVDYEIKIDDEWIMHVAESPVNQPKFIIAPNSSLTERRGNITLMTGGKSVQVVIVQGVQSLRIPSDISGMSRNAKALASQLKLGWNLGNALEAASSSTVAGETLWGNPRTNKELIDAVKAAGFNAIRIPCAWSGYMEDQVSYQVKLSWLNRVKEVVDYCIENDMYVIINTHWDGGWLEENPTYARQAEVNKKFKILWEQIAVYFRDYDEHLLFAGTNEVRANYNTPTTEHNIVQQSYNQTFVHAVRSTGGRNTYRNLIIQSYNTNIQFAVDFLEMPQDETPDRLMAEVHFYDPWDFAGDDKSNKYLWGAQFVGSVNVSSWGQESWIDDTFRKMKTNFVDKGIPVVLGEYGAILRSGIANQTALQNHVKSRNNYLAYVTKAAVQNQLIPFYWDNGHTGHNGFGLFNRSTAQIVHQDAIEAIMSGIN